MTSSHVRDHALLWADRCDVARRLLDEMAAAAQGRFGPGAFITLCWRGVCGATPVAPALLADVLVDRGDLEAREDSTLITQRGSERSGRAVLRRRETNPRYG